MYYFTRSFQCKGAWLGSKVLWKSICTLEKGLAEGCSSMSPFTCGAKIGTASTLRHQHLQIRCCFQASLLMLSGLYLFFFLISYYCTMMFNKYLVKICLKNDLGSLWNVWMTWTVTFVSLPITALVMDTTNWPKLDFFLFTWHSAILLCITQNIGKKQ